MTTWATPLTKAWNTWPLLTQRLSTNTLSTRSESTNSYCCVFSPTTSSSPIVATHCSNNQATERKAVRGSASSLISLYNKKISDSAAPSTLTLVLWRIEIACGPWKCQCNQLGMQFQIRVILLLRESKTMMRCNRWRTASKRLHFMTAQWTEALLWNLDESHINTSRPNYDYLK